MSSTYRLPVSPLDRAQLTWLLIGLAVLVACLGLQVVWVGVTGRESPEVVQMLLRNRVLVISIAMALAVSRYRLFDVDRLLRLSVTWFLMAGLVMAACVTLTYPGSRTALAMVRAAMTNDPTTPVLAGVVVAALASPLDQQLLGSLDRGVFRERVGRRLVPEETATVPGRAQPASTFGSFSRASCRRVSWVDVFLDWGSLRRQA
jgi:hypothetical protein